MRFSTNSITLETYLNERSKGCKKSEEKVLSMFDTGVSVMFVSHSLAQVKRICNKAMILDHGSMLAYGDIDEVAEIYQRILE